VNLLLLIAGLMLMLFIIIWALNITKK